MYSVGIIAVLFVLLAALALNSAFGELGCGLCVPPLSNSCAYISISYGTVFKYNTGYPTKYVGSDIWDTTWDDLGNIMTVSDDFLGWQGAGNSNQALSQLTTSDTSTTGTVVNGLASWGAAAVAGTDGATFKATGIISVLGKLYIATARQVYQNSMPPYIQTSANLQIIKSTDHGSTFTPVPPSTGNPYSPSEFAGAVNSSLSFIQYGQDYQAQTADNSGTYVYGVSNEGCWNNCSFLYLGRVAITNMPNLSSADWSYWQGGDGMVSANWGAWSTAMPLLQGTKKIGGLSQAQYFPGLGVSGCYIYTNWWYPSVTAVTGLDATNTMWETYAAPAPWGPWTKLDTRQWNTAGSLGLYSPNIIPKSVSQSGRVATATILTTGDYVNNSSQTGDYTLTEVPLTLTQH